MTGRPSVVRVLIRKLSIDDVRAVVDHYGLPRARSIEEMIDLVIRKVGRDLSKLVAQDGPFAIETWNDIAVNVLGGRARRSFEAVRDELTFRLDRVVEEFDIDERISEIRENPTALRRLAQLLDLDRDGLSDRLRKTHGRTLLGHFVADLRREQTQGESSAASDVEDSDEEQLGESRSDEAESSGPALATRFLSGVISFDDVGHAWPAKGRLSLEEGTFAVRLYARPIGGSARGNLLERRFQNPSQRSPIVDDPNCYELLFGIWIEQGDERAVVVAFDPYRRVGRTSRFSLFMPLSLLEEAADTGFATHENAKGELLYAFRPENLPRYIRALMAGDLWMLDMRERSSVSASPRNASPPQQHPQPTERHGNAAQSIYIRPRVGMYSAFARLNYKPWFALAEFLDNAIQSYLHNRQELSGAGHEGPLIIDLTIEDSEISITDRAGGIAWKDFPRAFSPAAPPDDASGLSEFGLGMKAAACWFSRRWTVRTSALGEPVERSVRFDIPKISKEGLENLPIEELPARESDHYTVVTLSDLRVHPRGRTLGKIREHLASIYRVLINEGVVKIRLTAGGRTEELEYHQPELLEAPYYKYRSAPRLWKKEFTIDLQDRTVRGWAGILKKGSHEKAGLSIFRRRRLIEGSVGETYKPSILFGNPNSFASQRVVGELFVEGFDVTHTKDGVQWHGYEDEILESIRNQINSPASPLLDQADGYRVRRTADTLPVDFGAEAVSETADALSQPAAAALIREQVRELSDAEGPSQIGVPAPITQRRIVNLQVVRDGTPWSIQLALVHDRVLPFYTVAFVAHESEEVIAVEVNLDHDFSINFINDNESALQPIVRLLAAWALGERIARQSGLKYNHFIRQAANNILSLLAAEETGL